MAGAVSTVDEMECVILTGLEVTRREMARMRSLACAGETCRPQWDRIEGTLELCRLMIAQLRNS